MFLPHRYCGEAECEGSSRPWAPAGGTPRANYRQADDGWSTDADGRSAGHGSEHIGRCLLDANAGVVGEEGEERNLDTSVMKYSG